ncbi:MAG: glycosyltransferase [Flavobacteriaceae bacterium]|nr:glycosyltransferase [Flavobacteriaceae bacterium]
MSIHPSKKILIAPLNWGLGHATRCIPIINAFLERGWEPILASDGAALALLQYEFPQLKTILLPSYHIRYSKKGNLQWHLFKQIPRIIKTMRTEHRLVQEIIQIENIYGIISDNRFGICSKGIPSVYITHQLTVLSGITTFLSTFLHRKITNQFDECWIPDSISQNLAGKLASNNGLKIPTKHIGAISRLKHQSFPKKYDISVLLSGTEPQRTILEKILLKELNQFNGTICFIRGVVSNTEDFKNELPFTFYNYLTTADLNKVLNQSDLIIARSGYSTILDLSVLGKKAFFIPTPGQTEQEYLANHLHQQKRAPFCGQSEFTFQKLEEIKNFTGFTIQENALNPELFEVFN